MNIDRTRLFDKRVVQRNIRAGRVTKDEYEAWLREVSDASDKVKARDEGGDDDGFDPSKPTPEPEVAPAEVYPAGDAYPPTVAPEPSDYAAPVAADPYAAAPDPAAAPAPAPAAPAPAAPAPAVAAVPPTYGGPDQGTPSGSGEAG